jgi:hypothetical protein
MSTTTTTLPTAAEMDDVLQGLPSLGQRLAGAVPRSWWVAIVNRPRVLKRWCAHLTRTTVGDPAAAAWDLARHTRGIGRRWAFHAIERARVGDPALVAYYAVRERIMSPRRALTIMERVTVGDPPWAAYLLASNCGGDVLRERVFRLIERASVGDPARAAYYAARDLGMDRERVYDIIERARGGPVSPTDALIQRLPPLPDRCLLTLDFARQWVEAAGEDPTPIKGDWCWRELAARYPHLRALWWEYLARATTGDPAGVAYSAALRIGGRVRAYQVIERAYEAGRVTREEKIELVGRLLSAD